MRDIRADLQDRAEAVVQKIRAENTRFESLLAQIEREQLGQLAHLRAQLCLANKLLEFTVWQDRLRAELAARIALSETAEKSIKDHFGGGTCSTG
jgi:hypothetical protein